LTVVDDAVVSQFRYTNPEFGHLFEPAIRQIHASLKPGGLYCANSSIKLAGEGGGQTVPDVVEKIEALGFRCLASEDLREDCVKGMDLMEEHCFGPQGCLTEEIQKEYPLACKNMQEEYIDYYRRNIKRGKKSVGIWTFQKL